MKKICYVGIYKPTAPRDKVYLEDLKRRGVSIVECVSREAGLRKYIYIYRMIRKSGRGADIIWVGYLSVGAVIVAFLALGGKKLVYNALGSSYEAYILDRKVAGKYSLKSLMFWVADFLAFHLSRTVLVESEAQRRYLAKLFFVPSRKLHAIFTGADEDIFHPDQSVQKRKEFTVVFRGMFIPATGVEVVLEAARLLKHEHVKFVISGWGQLQEKVVRYIEQNDLKNVELNTVFLEPDALRKIMLSGHVLLGQFSSNPRLDRTIQHKNIEALALGQPLITRDSVSNRELLADGKNCLFVPPEDARALADKILFLKSHPDVAKNLTLGARKYYNSHLTPKILGENVWSILSRH